MNNEFELNKSWMKLVKNKRTRDAVKSDLSDSEFSILCFISLEPTTRARILRHNYFKSTSLSTVKRSVESLILHGLISATVGELDTREKILQLV